MQDITAEEFVEILKSKTEIQILDVREKIEFHTFNIGGLNIPLGQLTSVLEDEDLDFDPEKSIVVICQHGLRSKTAKLILEKAGFKFTQNLLGGLAKFQRLN